MCVATHSPCRIAFFISSRCQVRARIYNSQTFVVLCQRYYNIENRRTSISTSLIIHCAQEGQRTFFSFFTIGRCCRTKENFRRFSRRPRDDNSLISQKKKKKKSGSLSRFCKYTHLALLTHPNIYIHIYMRILCSSRPS